MTQTIRSKLRQLAKLSNTEYIGLVDSVDRVSILSGWFVVDMPHMSPRQYKLYERNGNGAHCAGGGDGDRMCSLLDLTISYYKKKEVL